MCFGSIPDVPGAYWSFRSLCLLGHEGNAVLVADSYGKIPIHSKQLKRHHHALALAQSDGVLTLLGRQMEYVNLQQGQSLYSGVRQNSNPKKNKRLTASDDRVFGTAIRASLSSERGSDDISHREKVQKFMVLISSMYSSQGFGLSSAAGSTGSVFASESSSASRSCQTMSLLSLPCLQQTNKQKNLLLSLFEQRSPASMRRSERGKNLRDESISTPAADPQQDVVVGPPHRPGSHDCEVPDHDEPVRIAGDQPLVVAHKRSRVHLRLVPAKDGARVGRLRRHWRGGGGHPVFFLCVCVYGSSPVKRVSGEDLLSPSLRISSIRGSSVDKYLHGS